LSSPDFGAAPTRSTVREASRRSRRALLLPSAPLAPVTEGGTLIW
jgi:hypothetical protein